MGDGREDVVVCDHVIAATGYEPDMRKVPFLAPELVERISPRQNVTLLSETFETGVKGLYAVGLSAMHNFGPADAVHGGRGIRRAARCRFSASPAWAGD